MFVSLIIVHLGRIIKNESWGGFSCSCATCFQKSGQLQMGRDREHGFSCLYCYALQKWPERGSTDVALTRFRAPNAHCIDFPVRHRSNLIVQPARGRVLSLSLKEKIQDRKINDSKRRVRAYWLIRSVKTSGASSHARTKTPDDRGTE
jgi:hypothetical protein